MDLGLGGKRAVVLAASKGLGRATAEALAAEGASLVICARDRAAIGDAAADIGKTFGVPSHGFACDVSDPAALSGFFDKASRALGGIDILVNNAGGPPAGPTDNFQDDAWHSAIELTLMSVIRGCRAVLPSMKANKWGRIVNITSVATKQPLPNMALSNTLRAAVAGFSKSLALEVGSFGILVHCIMPGSFLTARNRSLGEAAASAKGIPYENVVREWEATVPLGRMGEPSEFGRMVAFFASDACTFTTGTCVAVEGGQIRSIV